MFDLAISSNHTVTPDGIRKASVLIRNGKIAGIIDEVKEKEFPIVEVGDLVLMAGIVDSHVHINEPGRTDWEGFDTATLSAIAGGITSLVDMPLNSTPVTTTLAAFQDKMNSMTGQLHCNCGCWGGIVPGNHKEIESLIDNGVLGFKAFLTHSGIDDFPNVTERELRKAMPIIARSGLPLLVHAELSGETGTHYPPSRSYSTYLASRPCSFEDKAIELMIRLCEEFGCRTHIVHLSSANSIEQIADAKQRGLPLTVETGQHYLYFNAEDIEDGRTEFKCAPPIRDRSNNERLWDALKAGIIDFVATDHSPAPPEMKHPESGDFMNAWGGISSIQFALPALWTAAQTRNASLNDIAKWLCSGPARLAGASKGELSVGYDADFVIWDPHSKFKVLKENILHRHKTTPYMGEQLSGIVHQTWLAGKKVFEQGRMISPNEGKILLGQQAIIKYNSTAL